MREEIDRGTMIIGGVLGFLCIALVVTSLFEAGGAIDEEISPSTYRFLERTADQQERHLIMRFMEDGRITYDELGELNDFNERRAVPIAQVKKELAQ